MKIKCFNCGYTYNPINKNESNILKGEILVNRYGQDNYGKHIDYMVCTFCDRFYLVQISLIKSIISLTGISSPYILKSKPLHLKDIRNEANKIYDNTDKELEEILEFDLGIPPHVVRFLGQHDILSIDKLGIKFRNRYIDLHTSYPRSEEEMIRDDINWRLNKMKELDK